MAVFSLQWLVPLWAVREQTGFQTLVRWDYRVNVAIFCGTPEDTTRSWSLF